MIDNENENYNKFTQTIFHTLILVAFSFIAFCLFSS